MIPFLDAEHGLGQPSKPARVAMVQTFLGPRNSDHFYQLKVDVNSGEITDKRQLAGCHPHVDASDMQKAEAECLKDARVQAAIKAMQLPEGATVKIEPWTYATDGMNDMSQKITMVSHHDVFTPVKAHRVAVLLLHATYQPPRCESLCIPTRSLRRNVWRCTGPEDILSPTWNVERYQHRCNAIRPEENPRL